MVYYSLFEKMMKERAKKEDPFGFSVYFRAAPEYNGGNEGGQETMKIAGLQKTTLLDYPGKVACTVFLAGCNFRCPYCQNAEIAFAQGGEDIPPEELLAFLRRRRGILDGVCVTGGEPLVHAQIGELLRKIKALGYAVKLDTNGSFPARLKALCAEGLVDFVAMDIKHAPAQYARAAGVPVPMGRELYQEVFEGVPAALDAAEEALCEKGFSAASHIAEHIRSELKAKVRL